MKLNINNLESEDEDLIRSQKKMRKRKVLKFKKSYKLDESKRR